MAISDSDDSLNAITEVVYATNVDESPHIFTVKLTRENINDINKALKREAAHRFTIREKCGHGQRKMDLTIRFDPTTCLPEEILIEKEKEMKEAAREAEKEAKKAAKLALKNAKKIEKENAKIAAKFEKFRSQIAYPEVESDPNKKQEESLIKWISDSKRISTVMNKKGTEPPPPTREASPEKAHEELLKKIKDWQKLVPSSDEELT
jgi:hypothetical protein